MKGAAMRDDLYETLYQACLQAAKALGEDKFGLSWLGRNSAMLPRQEKKAA